MAQIQHVASLLAAPTVFIGLWTLIFIFYSQRGGLIRETKLPMQELELKLQGGGVFAGFYSTIRLAYIGQGQLSSPVSCIFTCTCT